jgi:hypothetical protein
VHSPPAGGARSRERSHDVEAEQGRHLLEERAGPGGADLVHLEADDGPPLETDVLRILPSDVEDRIRIREEPRTPRCMRGDLVHREIGADDLGHEPPP